MQTNKPLSSKAVLAILALIIVLPFGYSVVYSVFAPGAQPFVEQTDERHGTQCVLEQLADDPGGPDPDYVRFHHMDLLKEIRDEAVRKTGRGDLGFHDCWECHPSRDRFCDRCHHAVNLDLDCFRCHYAP